MKEKAKISPGLLKAFKKLSSLTRSRNPVLKGYGRVAEMISVDLENRQHRWKIGWHVTPKEDHVNTANLKKLARDVLPVGSNLRKLIEGEKDDVLVAEWLGKMDIYARLLEDEVKELDWTERRSSPEDQR